MPEFLIIPEVSAVILQDIRKSLVKTENKNKPKGLIIPHQTDFLETGHLWNLEYLLNI